ncbi:MAG: Ger(x)C family spore germination protein [Bacilli bacterium]|nr:Ger(x)C family spore germination protein [Bacilli bacterium]
MKKIKILLLILIIIPLTGCNYMELNKLAIVSALGIDYKDNKYEITAQVMDIQKTTNGDMSQKSIIYEAEGKTIGKAIRNLSEKYPKTIYLGHLEIIILGKEIAEEKTNDTFDFLIRSPEVRSTGNILVNKYQSAKETLNPKNEKENSFATEQIKSSLENATKRTGTVKMITFEEFIQEYLQKGIDPVIPIIRIGKNKDETSNTIITHLAPLKNNKIEKELDEKQSIAYNTINNNYDDIVITPEYKNNTIGIILYNPKSKIKTKIKNNKIITNINITIEAKANELNQKINPNNKRTQKELEQIIKKELEDYIQSLINYCKETDSDILGLKNIIYKNYYKEYKNYKNLNLYTESNIKINIKTKIYRSGSINKGEF